MQKKKKMNTKEEKEVQGRDTKEKKYRREKKYKRRKIDTEEEK